MFPTLAATVDDPTVTTLAERLQDARLQRGWTRQQLADRAGYQGTETIRRYESGLVAHPREAILIRFAHVLHVSPVWLVTGRGPRALKRNSR